MIIIYIVIGTEICLEILFPSSNLGKFVNLLKNIIIEYSGLDVLDLLLCVRML